MNTNSRVSKDLREWLREHREHLTKTDSQLDAEIANMQPQAIWEAFLEWNGILGWGSTLHQAHMEVFGANGKAGR